MCDILKLLCYASCLLQPLGVKCGDYDISGLLIIMEKGGFMVYNRDEVSFVAVMDYIIFHPRQKITCIVTCNHVNNYVSSQNRTIKNIKPFYLSLNVK